LKPCIIHDKAIFLHIPKTGGISVEALFGIPHKGGLNRFHVHSWKIKNQIPEIWKDYFTFTIVRNPWDRVVSCFFWIMKNIEYVEEHHTEKGIKILPIHVFFDQFNSDFKEFLKYFKKHPRYTIRRNFHLQPQTNWIIDQSTGEELDIDFIGRFETLEEDVKKVCEELDLPFKRLPHKNKSNRKHYKKYYDDNTKKIIEDIYKEEIQLLGYEF
jgi:hypothetical protein